MGCAREFSLDRGLTCCSCGEHRTFATTAPGLPKRRSSIAYRTPSRLMKLSDGFKGTPGSLHPTANRCRIPALGTRSVAWRPPSTGLAGPRTAPRGGDTSASAFPSVCRGKGHLRRPSQPYRRGACGFCQPGRLPRAPAARIVEAWLSGSTEDAFKLARRYLGEQMRIRSALSVRTGSGDPRCEGRMDSYTRWRSGGGGGAPNRPTSMTVLSQKTASETRNFVWL